MSIIIEGRILKCNNSMEPKQYTAEEATELIKEGYDGMLSFFGRYEIDGKKYHASSLSVGGETFIYEKEGKLVVPTYFSTLILAGYESEQPKMVFVDVIIDPNEVESLFLTLVKK